MAKPPRARVAFDLFVQAGKEFAEDRAPRQAAAIAYYALFALGPLLLVAVAVAGLFFGADDARGAVTQQIGRLVGPEGEAAVGDLMAARGGTREGVVGLVAGGLALLLGAAGVFSQLRLSLNTVWEVAEVPPEGWKAKVARALRRNFLGVAGALGTGFLLLVSLALQAGLAAVAQRAEALLPGPEAVWSVLNLLVALAVVALLFALMFRFLPDARVAWRDVLVGAGVTAVLFVAGEAAIGFYLGQAATASRYGAAGAVLVVLLWIYYSCIILLYGAELTQVYANRFGATVRPSRRARSVQEDVRRRHEPPHREGTKGSHKEGRREGLA